MKENKDIFDDDFFPFDFEQALLPDCLEITDEGEKEHDGLGAWQLFLALAIAVTSIVLIFVALIIYVGAGRTKTVGMPAETESVEEWRGAFASKDIYEAALLCSVRLVAGQGDELCEWSGVIVSEDGWIATDKNAVTCIGNGRIYVVLNDGREYGVDSFFLAGDTAALKIEAQGLEAATVSEDKLQVGESIICIGGGELYCGRMSDARGERVSIAASALCRGAPVFDAEGGLLGVACSTESPFLWNCSATELGEILSLIKNK